MLTTVASRELVAAHLGILGGCSEIHGQAFAEYIFEKADA
jgi:hypothetical protein